MSMISRQLQPTPSLLNGRLRTKATQIHVRNHALRRHGTVLCCGQPELECVLLPVCFTGTAARNPQSHERGNRPGVTLRGCPGAAARRPAGIASVDASLLDAMTSAQ